MKINRDRVRRTLYWLAAELVVLAVFLLLLVHKPAGYQAAVPDTSGRVSYYLTHKLGQEFYNNVQLAVPFELSIEEAELNDIVMSSGWTGDFGETRTSAPILRLTDGGILLMTSVFVSGMEFVATLEVRPSIDAEGRLSAALHSVKVGAVPVTLVAKSIARKMYAEHAAGLPADDIRVRIAGAICENRPFVPVLEVGDKMVKINRITVQEGRMSVGFIPVKDTR